MGVVVGGKGAQLQDQKTSQQSSTTQRQSWPVQCKQSASGHSRAQAEQQPSTSAAAK